MMKNIRKVIIAFIIFILGLILSIFKMNKIVLVTLFICSYLIVGYPILKKAFKNIIKGKVIDESFLMTIATIGAFLIGEYAEGVAVMLFYQVGELFQSYAVDKSRKSIASLMDIKAEYANVVKENNTIKIEPEKVDVGEIILIKPGEKVPLDGKVIWGASMIDTKALTGEVVPRSVKVGDVINNGMINQSGLLKIRTIKRYEDSTVKKILDLVENASSEKTKSENFMAVFAKYYTPIVVGLALLLVIIPPFIFRGSSFITWIYRALSFLVVSCPCALVISIPLSFFSGIGRCSKEGILVKGSNYLECLAKSKIVAFDKTGTLTEGVFEVSKIVSVDKSIDEFMEMVCLAEHYSNHPIAISIKKKYNKEIDSDRIKDFDEVVGEGARAKIGRSEVLVGNDKLMDRYEIEYPEINEMGTVSYVAINGKYVGYILISDQLKKDIKKTMRELRNLGIKKMVMLTGDKENVAKYVTDELEMDQVCAELLPADKVSKVKSLMEEKLKNECLCFVGDGMNDAPVLALSDVGIAMGGLGSDAAIEAADIVIMNDDIRKMIDAKKIALKTLKIVKENIYFVIGVKVIVLILSALGITSMWMAVFADVGVTVIAVINSLRILFGDK